MAETTSSASLPGISRSPPFSPLDFACAGLMVALTFALYHPALGLFWHGDDFFHLRVCQQFSALDFLTSAEAWRSLPFRMVTPLLFHSLKLDLWFAGPSPAAFYLHQTLAVAASGLALFVALRLWVGPWASLAAAASYLGSAPLGAAAVALMARHYPETLALAALAVASFTLALRRGDNERPHHPWLVASAGLYALACLGKEIAVPLPLALLLLPERTWRLRLRAAAPHGMVLLGYLVYRWYLLGTFGGGYGWAVEAAQYPGLALVLPAKLLAQMAGEGGPWAWGFLAFTFLLTTLAVAKTRHRFATLCRWLALCGLVLAPLLPVSLEMSPRYAVLPAALAAVGLALGLEELLRAPGSGRLGRLAAPLVCLVWVTFAWRESWPATLAGAERVSSENRALFELGSGDLLLEPADFPAALAELEGFRRTFSGKEGATWSYDEMTVCEGEPPSRLWRFDPGSGTVVEQTARLPALCSSWRRLLRPEAPLSASFESREAVLTWRLGPYKEGRYALLTDEGLALFALPASGAFHRGPQSLEFRLRYESPEGWLTYSPPLSADFTREPNFEWRRPAP